MNIHGNVRSVTEKYYTLLLKKGDFKKGNLLSTTVYTFNDKGYLVEEAKKSIDSWSKQEQSTATTYTYDSEGHLMEQAFFSKGNMISRTVYQYNERGAMSGLTGYSPDGRILEKKDFKLDDKGRAIEVLWYGTGGNSLENKLFYRYDDMGNQVECSTAGKDGKVYKRKYFRYDSLGRMKEVKEVVDQKQISWNAFTYDQAGNNLESTSLYENGVVFTVARYRTTYDKNENWTSRMLSVDGQPGFLYERSIQYQ